VSATEGYVLWTRSDVGRAVLWQVNPSLPVGPAQLTRVVSLYSTSGIGAGWQATSYAPGTEAYTLAVQTSNPASGASMAVTPADLGARLDGTSPLQRTYARGTAVTITAPELADGNPFESWSGCDSVAGTACTLVVDGPRVVTATFATATSLGSCEGCHNADAYAPGVGAAAPNVMGDGALPEGDPGHLTPTPFDDGSYGYNVNGHGRDADTSGASHGNRIAAACVACHDIADPPGRHLDGTLDGRTPSADNPNPFHLVAGFLASTPLAAEWSVQVTFDNYCYSACHQGRTTNMRHAHDAVPAANAVELGTHNSYEEPMNTPPPYMFYDANITWLGTFNGAPNFGLCVSCHDPHGTNVSSSRLDQNNKMMVYRWTRPAELCSKCHP
jgi:cytochrome c553